MKTAELIGKKIADVKDKIATTDASNELLTSSGVIELETGEIFTIPYCESDTLLLIKNDSSGYTSVFNEGRFFKGLVSKIKYKKEVAERNKEHLKGNRIVGIYQFEDEHVNSLAEKMIIELENGYLIGEVAMSPFGTGAAGVHVFSSLEELRKKHDQNLKKIY